RQCPQHLHVSARSQLQSRCGVLFRFSRVAIFCLTQGRVHLPKCSCLLGIGADRRIHCPPREIPCLRQVLVVRLGIGLGGEERVFISRLICSPSQLLLHL